MVVERRPYPEKLLCQPQVRQKMVVHGRNTELAFSFRECDKGNDLVRGEPVHSGPSFHVFKELFGHVLPYEFSCPPQGAGLIRPQTHSLTEIGKQRQDCAGLQGLPVVLHVDVGPMPRSSKTSWAASAIRSLTCRFSK